METIIYIALLSSFSSAFVPYAHALDEQNLSLIYETASP